MQMIEDGPGQKPDRRPGRRAPERWSETLPRRIGSDDAAIGAAMRALYEDTHQLVEGAGAAPLAALLKERDRLRGKKAAVILSGGNIDRPLYARILAGD